MLRRYTKIAVAVAAPTVFFFALIQIWDLVTPQADGRVERYADLPLESTTRAKPSEHLRVSRSFEHAGEVTDVNDMVAVGRWIVILAPRNRRQVIAVDTKSDAVYDLTSRIGPHIGGNYTMVWPGHQRETIVFGSIREVPLVEVSLAGLGSDDTTLSIRKIPRSGAWDFSMQLSQSSWISTTGWHSGSLAVGSIVDGVLVHGPNQAAPIFPDMTSPLVSMMLNRSKVAVSPDRQRLARAFMMSCRINIIAADGSLERQLASPVDIKLEYDVYLDQRDGQEKMVPHRRTKFCYTGLAAADVGIVALFAGNAFTEFRDRFGLGEQVHYLSWDGRTSGVWQLEGFVSGIAMPRDGSKLWAVDVARKRIVEYDTPPRYRSKQTRSAPRTEDTVASSPHRDRIAPQSHNR